MSIANKYITWLLQVLGVLVSLGQFALLYFLFDIDAISAAIDSAISVITFFITIWGVTQSIRLYPTRVGLTFYSLFIALFFSIVMVYTSSIMLNLWFSYNVAYSDFIQESLPIRYVIAWLLFSWYATYTALTKNIISQEKKFKQQADTSTLLKEAELFKLRQQLQPHFLYNSLNSISALTAVAPERAQEMVEQLSDFLRSSVKREATESIPLEEELAFLRSYLAIETIRFGDRLNVIFENKTNNNSSMPPFLLQPIMENAIKFGLYGTTGKVNITIQIEELDELLLFTIRNPYDPDSTQPRGTGFGLNGIQRRLNLLYARNDLLSTFKDSDTFTTVLKIPQEHV